MAMRDLIPWSRGRDLSVRREEASPFWTLHREMNRLFEDVFRGFDVAPFGNDRLLDRGMGWPNIEVSETDKELKVMAELPGLEEKDIDVELAHGALTIRGEKRPRRKTRIGCSASAATGGSSGGFRSITSSRTRSRPRSRTAC
jgi:HSP20 family protein